MVRLEEQPNGWSDTRTWDAVLGSTAVGYIELRNGQHYWHITEHRVPVYGPHYGAGLGLYDCTNKIERALGVLV